MLRENIFNGSMSEEKKKGFKGRSPLAINISVPEYGDFWIKNILESV